MRAVTATHYRITLDPATRSALAGLSPGELAWFEVEYPDLVDSIEVWVADGLVHRMQVEGPAAVSTTAFYDFGADISIHPPAKD